MHFNLLTALAVLSYTGLNMVHASHCVPTTVITCPRDSDEHPLNQPMACVPTADDPVMKYGPPKNWCRFDRALSDAVKFYCCDHQ
ncbi:hypothetical protein ACJQWK_00541 [Exserohilum turcicum]